MDIIPGYTLTEKLYQSQNSEVYRALRVDDEQAVVVKLLRADYPSPEQIARFKREFEIVYNLDIEGVIKPYALENNHHRWGIVLEDLGAQSLTALDLIGNLSIEDFLEMAIQLADIVGQIHQHQIIHKDINPTNIIFNATTKQLKLIDFGISTVLSREKPNFRNPNVLEGTLPYISPEQTGRTNRTVDYRTDFYSLGITFYELLTGQPPFQSNDPMELVHSHLAKQAPLAYKINPEIPECLAEIVARLMAKNAKDRYKSAYGLKADLEMCLDLWRKNKRTDLFPLGANDISDKLQIPQKLYGRKKEIATLMAAFERVATQSLSDKATQVSQMMLIAGYSGIGKSALVHELYQPITRSRGYFITGKFDQLQRNIPYKAIVGAFSDLIQQLLTEREAELATWREKLSAALGPNGQVLIDVIPEVELIVGPQPHVQELGATEAQNRFNLVFQNFIRVFCQPAHPLVIFLDDLQWADSASLKLLALMLTDEDIVHLFVIGAYRDNEVHHNHPLTTTLNKLRKQGVTFEEINLAPLAIDHIADLMADTLYQSLEQVKPLAELVVKKTEGNPFFTSEFLKTLYQDGWLTFVPPNQQDRFGGWQWDIKQIEAVGITDNVIELMVAKLKKLPKSTQHILRLAACMGNKFDLNILTIIAQQSKPQLFRALLPAIQDGLILPVSELEALLDEDATDLLVLNHKFLHDRVQQAAYALIAEDERAPVHLQIGQLLLISATDKGENFFEIVDHLNLGRALIEDEAARIQLAELNLEAGQKAKDATAYVAAKEYLTAGLSDVLWSNGFDWDKYYDLLLNLYKDLAEVAYLNGNFEVSTNLVNHVLTKVTSNLDKVKLYNLLIIQETMAGDYRAAIERGRQALAALDVHIPKTDAQQAFEQELMLSKKMLGEQEISTLLSNPAMTQPDKKVVMQLLMNLLPPMYLIDPILYDWTVVKMVNLSFEYGHVPESAKGYVNYGHVLVSHLEDYQAGYDFGLLGLKLSEKLNAISHKAKILFTFGAYLSHWVRHLRWSETISNEGYETCLDVGDLQYAGYTLAFHKSMNEFFLRRNLQNFQADLDRFLAFGQKTQNTLTITVVLAAQLAVFNLQGVTADKFTFDKNDMTEADYLKMCQTQNSHMAICFFNLLKGIIFYLYNDPKKALAPLQTAKEMLQFIPATMPVAELNVYYSLTLIALYPTASTADQKQYQRQLEANQAQMKLWADNCPANFLMFYLLVEAETSRLFGNHLAAMEQYDQAIEAAKENKFVLNEALANELTARFWLQRNKPDFALFYLKQAHYNYQQWGALRKVSLLEKQYPQLQQTTTEDYRAKTFQKPTATISTAEYTTALDLSTVIKASQAISGEIVLEQLLKKLMNIVIENAGAQKGFLILEQDGDLIIEAEGLLLEGQTAAQVKTLQAVSVRDSDRLAHTIINYVARTKEQVILNDAITDNVFSSDPYIKEHQPHSLLCTPLINQGYLIGLLYLENRLTTGAFTPDRTEILQLLSAQAAISIENARLYSNLVENEQKYRTLFEDSRDAIFISTSAGQFIDFNQAMLNLFDYSRAEMIELPVEKIFQDNQQWLKFQQVIEKIGSVHDFEIKGQRKDGRLLACLLTVTMRHNNDDGNTLYQGIIRDITTQKQAEQERLKLSALQRELSIAQEIQHSLLPPPKPDWPELNVICYSTPARDVGGDFYSYHTFAPQNDAIDVSQYVEALSFAVAIGDVSGKGVSAALLMATSLSLFNATFSQNFTLAERLIHLDKALLPYTQPRRQNCALSYLEIYLTKSRVDQQIEVKIHVVNAGCIPPYIKQTDGQVEWLEVGGFALGQGLGADWGYQEVTRTLAKGDMIILSSDGVVEAYNNQKEIFGFDRLEEAIQSGPQTNAEDLLEHLKREINKFVGQTEPHDDLTMVIIQI